MLLPLSLLLGSAARPCGQLHAARALILRSPIPTACTPSDDAGRAAPADDAIGAIVRDELASLTQLDSAEAQVEQLPTLLARVEERANAADAATGATAKAVVETTRAEVQRLLKADWDMADLGLLLRVALFLGAGAAAPAAGLAAMPVAALLGTYGAVLKVELGGRAVKEVGHRVAERAKQGVADGVREFTGKVRRAWLRARPAARRRSCENIHCAVSITG